MSLTLPYPDLDFVPLDVLTAEEMNQVVSNYTYISDQFPLTSDNIGQGAITSQNIDFTTLTSEFTVQYNTTNVAVNNSIGISSLGGRLNYICCDASLRVTVGESSWVEIGTLPSTVTPPRVNHLSTIRYTHATQQNSLAVMHVNGNKINIRAVTGSTIPAGSGIFPMTTWMV